MEEIKPATETTTEVAPTIAPEEDLEAKYAAIEEEKAKLAEQRENYRKAEAKYKEKLEAIPENDSDEEKLRRIAREELANSQVLDLAREQDEIIRKALKENKELKLAQLNKTGTPPATLGAHSETVAVKDTLITPEQLEAFKAKGWSDKDIERYKTNLRSKI